MTGQQTISVRSVRRERTADLELLVAEALADLLASPAPDSSLALDDCAEKIVKFFAMSSEQRRGLCERLAQVRLLARVPPRQFEGRP